VSACLFGDGAAAAVLSPAPRAGARAVEWKSAATLTNPGERDALRFEQRNGMLRNILTLPVPKLAALHARRVLDDALARESMRREDVDAWIVHAGGRRVLEELRREIGISGSETSWSAAMLRDYGNLSSPFVLFVLQAALRGGAKGGWWWMTSFGAGFSCHGALLRVA
jgi:alkylresorcinol/alkylpyrone synthase